jgi:hypothetical protein
MSDVPQEQYLLIRIILRAQYVKFQPEINGKPIVPQDWTVGLSL